jgi:hypothetical protein
VAVQKNVEKAEGDSHNTLMQEAVRGDYGKMSMDEREKLIG